MNWPVSAKGIVFSADQRILLLKNDRNEWELPGGRLEFGEQPTETVVREIYEECGLRVSVACCLNSYTFEVVPKKHVLILPFLCEALSDQSVRISDEHLEYRYFPTSELRHIVIPSGYVTAIRRAESIRVVPQSIG
jgi:mutator protein MutT